MSLHKPREISIEVFIVSISPTVHVVRINNRYSNLEAVWVHRGQDVDPRGFLLQTSFVLLQ